MTEDNRNFILAIVMSMLIILGWNYFYAQPMLEKQRQQAEQSHKPPQALPEQPVPGQPSPAQPGSQAGAVPPAAEPSAAPAPGVPQPREAVLQQTPRLPIRTPSVEGSINLKGGALDDLRLTRYHETVDPKSPTIVLLSPSGSAGGFFAEHGFSQPAGSNLKLPNKDTVWTAPPGAMIEVGKPVTLTYDNGQGLVFRRTISIDPEYMFTVRQEVENRTGAPLSLYSYARVQRQGTPHVQGVYVLHEGLLGVLGGTPQGDHLCPYEGSGAGGCHAVPGRLARHHRQILGSVAGAGPDGPDRRQLPPHTQRRARRLPGGLSQQGSAERGAGRHRRNRKQVFAGAKVVGTINAMPGISRSTDST